MANGVDVPLFFTATSLEKEDWDDHTYLRHMGDGLTHLYGMMGGSAMSKWGRFGAGVGAALTVILVVLTAYGGPR